MSEKTTCIAMVINNKVAVKPESAFTIFKELRLYLQ